MLMSCYLYRAIWYGSNILRHHAMLLCPKRYYALLYYTTQQYTILYHAILYNIFLCCTYYTLLYHTVLYVLLQKRALKKSK